ncbi:hypothetical protein BX600DRAFT_517697 [Xylariales sp. PMI_506]|nr:hypothetical protein BX600DRAFT_517697 [Xylariales sp. PMI_506]
MAASDRPVKMVSESARERETFKYYPSLLSAPRYDDNDPPIPNSKLATSSSTILTALAQLGVCQTGAARSLISLFDHGYQYVIAEATPTLPLVPSLGHEGREDELWFCGTTIPRKSSLCEYALCAPPEAGDNSAELPLLKADDLAADRRFSDKLQCQLSRRARFYAAVPIRTRRGINIGVFCVLSPVVLETWTDRHTQIMRNISRAVMEHLEAERLASAHRRSERMTRGLGSFVEGKATISGWLYGPNPGAFEDNAKFEGALNANQQFVQNQQDDLENMMVDDMQNGAAPGSPSLQPMDTNDWTPEQAVPSSSDTPKQNGISTNSVADRDGNTDLTTEITIDEIFSKAANIIRESIEVEGCVFLDATKGSFGALTTQLRTDDSAASATQSPSTSSSDDGPMRTSVQASTTRSCQVLGYSTTDFSSIDGADALSIHGTMPKKFLSTLLRRYPRGKIFNFDRIGELQSSDSSEDDPNFQAPMDGGKTTKQGDLHANAPNVRRKNSAQPWAQKQEGYTMLKIFPGARSIAFVPIWDSKKERWSAGALVYTYAPSRIFTVEGELSFLRAFGMLAMTQVLRLDTALAEKAKSDTLSSLSHELRSPLHGIVLGIELMEDTQLDVFQGNITHTIETCCRTLVDTVDHLLDFSKINNLMGKPMKHKHSNAARGLRKKSIKSVEAGMKSLYSVVRLDALAEEVVESVFTGYNFQHISIAQLAKERTSSDTDVRAIRRLDAIRAMEDLDPSRIGSGELQVKFEDTSILLWIDPSCSWTFYAQAGAIRRIIMNLFGNALKYTSRGTIRVMLRQATSKIKYGNDERMVVISVADTGRGISEDYLRNGLFKPFSQENHLAPGTGLGLSLVKKLTNLMQGRVSIKSQVGIGTTVSVVLPLEPMSTTPPPNAPVVTLDDDHRFREQLQQLRGLRIRLRGFDDNGISVPNPIQDRYASGVEVTVRTTVMSICRDWLQMEILSDSQAEELVPDLVLWSEGELRRSEAMAEPRPVAPCIVMCANALTAYQQTISSNTREKPGFFEFISQPVTPRKLANVLTLTFQQWLDHQPIETPDTEFHPAVSADWPQPLFGRSTSYDFSVAATDFHTRIDSFAVNPSRRLSPAQQTLTGETSTPPVLEANSPAPSEHSSRFLLVDDNHINLKILASYMKKLGKPYMTATNGLEAVESYRREPDRYTCIFMDISMPVMDGFTATRRIRDFETENNFAPVTILALSGLASATAQQEAFGSGIDLFLTKPVKLKELGSILRMRGIIQ